MIKEIVFRFINPRRDVKVKASESTDFLKLINNDEAKKDRPVILGFPTPPPIDPKLLDKFWLDQ